MKKYLKPGITFFICIAAIAILWNQSHSKKDILEEQRIVNTSKHISFPKTYEEQVSDTFSIEAEVIVPENFDANQFYKATAHIVEPNEEKWKEKFLGNIQEYQHIEFEGLTREGNSLAEHGYICDGDREVYLSAQCASFYTNKVFYTENCLNWEEPTYEGYNIDAFSTDSDLDFMNRTKSWEKMQSELAALGIPLEDAVLESQYTLPYQTLQEQEELAVKRGDLTESEKKDIWNSDDDAYYAFIWQYHQGLPVFPYAYIDDFYVENLEGGITACYNANGFASLQMNYWMEFEQSKERLALLSLDKIMQTVIDKYNGVISNQPMKLTYCRLYEAPILKENDSYEIIPVWICKIDVEDMTNPIYLPINAVTGEEVEEMKLE